MTQTSSIRSWPKDGNCPGDPFKRGIKSPLRGIHQGDSPSKILIDPAHTYAIGGYGKDDLASALCFLACRCNHWGKAKNNIQLERAYDDFKKYCVDRGKTTSIMDFSYQTLKIKSFLCGMFLKIYSFKSLGVISVFFFQG